MRRLDVLDKKRSDVDTQRALRLLKDARILSKETDVSQLEATITLKPKHPDKPVCIWPNSDSHGGSIYTWYDTWLAHRELVMKTPNFYAISVGDEMDMYNINLGKASTGVYTNPISPEQQALTFTKLFQEMDDKGKLLAWAIGNHSDFMINSGLSYENTFLRNFQCPIFGSGGVLTINLGEQTYKVAMQHTYRGNSKKNPTNAAKNYIDFECHDVDAVILGHVHSKATEMIEKGGMRRALIITGTYQMDAEYGRKRGFGHPDLGGAILMLLPNKHKVMAFYSIEDVFDLMEAYT